MIQAIAIKHIDSGIQQVLFVNSRDDQKKGAGEVTYQATGFGKTTHRDISRAEANEFIDAWLTLEQREVLVITQQDDITLKSLRYS